MKLSVKLFMIVLAFSFTLSGCCLHHRHHGPMNCDKPCCAKPCGPTPCPMTQAAPPAAQ